MKLQHVTEPLNDPKNTVEMLLDEIRHQAKEVVRSSEETGDIAGDLIRKAEMVIQSQKAHREVKAEILRRFEALTKELAEEKALPKIRFPFVFNDI